MWGTGKIGPTQGGSRLAPYDSGSTREYQASRLTPGWLFIYFWHRDGFYIILHYVTVSKHVQAENKTCLQPDVAPGPVWDSEKHGAPYRQTGLCCVYPGNSLPPLQVRESLPSWACSETIFFLKRFVKILLLFCDIFNDWGGERDKIIFNSMLHKLNLRKWNII